VAKCIIKITNNNNSNIIRRYEEYILEIVVNISKTGLIPTFQTKFWHTLFGYEKAVFYFERTTFPRRYSSVTTVTTSNPTENNINYKYLKKALRKIF
jgi:hypothetical protein